MLSNEPNGCDASSRMQRGFETPVSMHAYFAVSLRVLHQHMLPAVARVLLNPHVPNAAACQPGALQGNGVFVNRTRGCLSSWSSVPVTALPQPLPGWSCSSAAEMQAATTTVCPLHGPMHTATLIPQLPNAAASQPGARQGNGLLVRTRL